MSRNTEYQFVPADTREVEARMIASYAEKSKQPVRPASPERLLIDWVASAILAIRVLVNYTGNQNIPSRAEELNLDALGELAYVLERPDAQCAVCTERFYISEPQNTAILIPAGNRVTDIASTLIWETVEDVYVPIGATYVDVQIRCQTPGIVGNDWAVGQINTFVDLYDYCLRCENITVSDDGADVPTDDEYYELMRASMDAYSTAGPKGAYEYHAKRVSNEIGDVAAVQPADTLTAELPLYERNGVKYAFFGGDTINVDAIRVRKPDGTAALDGTDYSCTYINGLLVIEIEPAGSLADAESISVDIAREMAGHVNIYVLMDDGNPAGDEIKAAVLAACNDSTIRPLTDYVAVLDPDIVEYDIDVTYYIPSTTTSSSADVEAAVEAATQEYIDWQCAKLGRDINPSKLYDLLMHTGIKRLEMRAPVFTRLYDGTEHLTPQLAKIRNINLVNGGHEHE